jgi:uncharacterized membrane protein YbhN (UPF0104 family)
LDVKAWQLIVNSEIPQLTYKIAFISTGKYILSKYIPGKFWIIVGRAGYIKEEYNGSLVNFASMSLYYQVIVLFAGTVTGCWILYFINIKLFWITLIAIIITTLFILLFKNKATSLASKILTFVFRKRICLPCISTRLTFQLFLISVFNWVVWSFAFYLFLFSVNSAEILQLKAGLIFPISTVLGIVVIIAPGGIGVREGFLTIGLIALGMQEIEAISVSVLSRLWFLIGELLFFGSAWLQEIKKTIILK